MTARVLMPDAIGEQLDGERRGERLIRALRDGFADPDEVAFAVVELFEADGVIVARTPRLRGFARAVRKALERAK